MSASVREEEEGCLDVERISDQRRKMNQVLAIAMSPLKALNCWIGSQAVNFLRYEATCDSCFVVATSISNAFSFLERDSLSAFAT